MYGATIPHQTSASAQAVALRGVWRGKQIEDTQRVATCARSTHDRPFKELCRAAPKIAIINIANCTYITRATGKFCDIFESQIRRLLTQYPHWSGFPENLSVLPTRPARGVASEILSQCDNRRQRTVPLLTACCPSSSAFTGFTNTRHCPTPARKRKKTL